MSNKKSFPIMLGVFILIIALILSEFALCILQGLSLIHWPVWEIFIPFYAVVFIVVIIYLVYNYTPLGDHEE